MNELHHGFDSVNMPLFSPIVYIVIGISTSVAAQILVKIAGQQHMFTMKWFLYIFLSLSSYSIAFVGYYMALKYFDISKAGPIMMASTVALIALYGFATGEPFNHLKLSGIVLAIIAICLIFKS
jgi:drug/metabolite transporter (DMT)-like permease